MTGWDHIQKWKQRQIHWVALYSWREATSPNCCFRKLVSCTAFFSVVDATSSSRFARAASSIRSCRARLFLVTPFWRRHAMTFSPSVFGSGYGSYPRNARMAGKYRISGSEEPFSQFIIVRAETPTCLPRSFWKSSSSYRLFWMCSPIVCGCFG